MIIISILVSLIVILVICHIVYLAKLYIKHRKERSKSFILYRQIETYKDTFKFYVIPTISISKVDYYEINFHWLCYGIYIAYKYLTDDQDLAIADAIYKIENNDKS